jgi:hypothetical protein
MASAKRVGLKPDAAPKAVLFDHDLDGEVGELPRDRMDAPEGA